MQIRTLIAEWIYTREAPRRTVLLWREVRNDLNAVACA